MHFHRNTLYQIYIHISCVCTTKLHRLAPCIQFSVQIIWHRFDAWLSSSFANIIKFISFEQKIFIQIFEHRKCSVNISGWFKINGQIEWYIAYENNNRWKSHALWTIVKASTWVCRLLFVCIALIVQVELFDYFNFFLSETTWKWKRNERNDMKKKQKQKEKKIFVKRKQVKYSFASAMIWQQLVSTYAMLFV